MWSTSVRITLNNKTSRLMSDKRPEKWYYDKAKMNHKLIYYPNEILRQEAKLVTDFTPDLIELANDMREIMKGNVGMGLAAPQLGDSRQLIVIEYEPQTENDVEDISIPFTILVNPKIVSTNKETNILEEGCLSVPYVEIPISRPTRATIAAQDVHGQPITIKAKGLLARILQHEIDHLHGKLILDYEVKAPESEIKAQPRVIMCGSTQFTTNLMNVLRPHLNIVHVITEPSKPSGRKLELTPTIAKRYSDTLGILTIEPTDLNDPRTYSYLLSLKPDLMIVAAYGRLIPEKLYELPKFGTLNVHPSLLPKYRGATPIQSAILAGDEFTGVTLMKLAPSFDTGEIVAQADYDLTSTETFEELEFDLAELGAELIIEVLPDYLKGNVKLIEQDESQAIKTRKYTAQDRWLNPEDGAKPNDAKVRAFAPEPSAFVVIDGQQMKILKAHIENSKLVFDMVQPANKKPMTWKEFLNGYRKPLQFEPYSTILDKQDKKSHSKQTVKE